VLIRGLKGTWDGLFPGVELKQASTFVVCIPSFFLFADSSAIVGSPLIPEFGNLFFVCVGTLFAKLKGCVSLKNLLQLEQIH
jgi:hypothetical protein